MEESKKRNPSELRAGETQKLGICAHVLDQPEVVGDDDGDGRCGVLQVLKDGPVRVQLPIGVASVFLDGAPNASRPRRLVAGIDLVRDFRDHYAGPALWLSSC